MSDQTVQPLTTSCLLLLVWNFSCRKFIAIFNNDVQPKYICKNMYAYLYYFPGPLVDSDENRDRQVIETEIRELVFLKKRDLSNSLVWDNSKVSTYSYFHPGSLADPGGNNGRKKSQLHFWLN